MSDTPTPARVVQYAAARGIARITFDSPSNRNALSLALVQQALEGVQAAAREPDLRALVLTGNGTIFCAGADLKEDPSSMPKRATAMLDLFGALDEFPLPIVVELNGSVRAGGLGFLGSADVVIAPASATFAFTEVRIGVVPAIIAITIMPRMSPRAVQRYFTSGETFSAAEAARVGLVSESVADDQVGATVEALLDHYRAAAPSALRATKKLLRERAGQPFTRDALASAAALSASIFASDDAREGMASFREKRKPRWAV